MALLWVMGPSAVWTALHPLGPPQLGFLHAWLGGAMFPPITVPSSWRPLSAAAINATHSLEQLSQLTLPAPFVWGDPQWWRLCTAPLLHGGWAHWLGNTLTLLVILVLLNKRRTYDPFTLSCVAHLISALSLLGRAVFVEGATWVMGLSGGLFGVLGFLVVKIESRGIKTTVISAVVVTLGWGSYLTYVGESTLNVDHISHLLGFALGAVFSVATSDSLAGRSERGDLKTIEWIKRVRFGIFAVFALGLTAAVINLHAEGHWPWRAVKAEESSAAHHVGVKHPLSHALYPVGHVEELGGSGLTNGFFIVGALSDEIVEDEPWLDLAPFHAEEKGLEISSTLYLNRFVVLLARDEEGRYPRVGFLAMFPLSSQVGLNALVQTWSGAFRALMRAHPL